MSRSSRRFIVVAAVVIALAVAGGLFAWWKLQRSKPTEFGWPATMITVAGDGQRGFADGAGARARFSDPFAVAMDAKGALYVADAGEPGHIRKVDGTGVTTTLPGTFDTPSGVAVDEGGDVYVAETGANRIRKIAANGAVTTIAGDGTAGFRDGAAAQAQFNGPIGIALDRAGGIYVADTYNDRIRLITPDGQVKTLAGGAVAGFVDGQGEAAAFNTPCGLTFNADGDLLIADAGNDAIRKLGKGGVVTTLARAASEGVGSALHEPVALAATNDGFVYVATFSRGRILMLSPKGEVLILTGRNASVARNQAVLMGHPAGLALDRDGALYVADSATYAIRRLARARPGDPLQPPEPAPPSPALMRAAMVPWPLDPQMSWHEIVGNMGEDRGGRSGDSRDHLHAGLDVRADVGQTVLAVADGRVVDPLAVFNLNGVSEGLQIDELTYIHMRVGRTPAGAPLDPARVQFLRDPTGKLASVRVKRGARFHVGDPLGTVNAMAHVHLELGARGGGEINPIGLKFPGLQDHFVPRIRGVELFDAGGSRLAERVNGRLILPRTAGAVGIVVDAWDQVDGDEPRRRLGLYAAGYQILRSDGTPVPGFEQPRINIEFDRLPLDRAAVKIAYAPDSGETAHGASETRFLYVVTNSMRGGHAEVGGWNPTALPPGDYTIRIFAADYAGNVAVEGRDLPITLR